MRVISGSAKGHTLRATKDPAMRPTSDMARTTIFDILGDVPVDARVLDLFAGAGTLGIEALSRGATHATFVEQNREACSVIEANLDATKLRERAVVRCSDVGLFLSRKPQTPFDLAFLDPPYERGLGFVARVLGEIAVGLWIHRGGTVVVEAEEGHIEWPPGFRETRTRTFGRTQVSMAVKDESEDGDLSGDF